MNLDLILGKTNEDDEQNFSQGEYTIAGKKCYVAFITLISTYISLLKENDVGIGGKQAFYVATVWPQLPEWSVLQTISKLPSKSLQEHRNTEIDANKKDKYNESLHSSQSITSARVFYGRYLRLVLRLEKSGLNIQINMSLLLGNFNHNRPSFSKAFPP